MKGLLVLLTTVAVASCSPTPGISGLDSLGGGGGGSGGKGSGINVPGAIVGGVLGGVPGAIIGGAIKKPVSIPGAIVGGALAGGPGAIVGGLLGGAAGAGGNKGAGSGLPGKLIGGSSGLKGLQGAGGSFPGLRPGGKTDRGYKQKGGVYPVAGGGIFKALAFLAQGLTDIVGNAVSILDDVIHLRIPAVLDDGFNAVISLGRALGGIVNALIPGLGSLLGNLVVSLGKILICILGSPGLTGSIFGRTPGKDNPRDIPYICTPDYGRNWGCSYNGPYDNDGSIISYYKLKNAKKQALQFLSQYTKGKGVGSLSGSRRIVVDRVLILADILDKGSNNWCDDDIDQITINIIIINGAIGESYQPGLGSQICDEWITNLKNNKNTRFPDLSKYRAQIFAALKGTTEDKWAGAFNQQKRSGWSKISSNSQDNSAGDDCNSNDNSSNDNDNNSNDDNSGPEDSNDNNGNNSPDYGASDSNDQDSDDC